MIFHKVLSPSLLLAFLWLEGMSWFNVSCSGWLGCLSVTMLPPRRLWTQLPSCAAAASSRAFVAAALVGGSDMKMRPRAPAGDEPAVSAI